MPYYSVTIKKTRGRPDIQDYENYIATMLQKNPRLQDCGHKYEYEKGLHIHMLLFQHGTLDYTQLYNNERQHGWRIYATECYNLAGWKNYINKTNDPLQVEHVATNSDEQIEDQTPAQIYNKYGRIV